MKRIDITFDNGYFYDGFGYSRRQIAYMKENGEICEKLTTFGCSNVLAYFDVETGNIYKNKTCFGGYWSRIAKIERNGDVYKGEETTFGKGEFVGELYSTEVDKIYEYLDAGRTNNTQVKTNSSQVKANNTGDVHFSRIEPISVLAVLFLGFAFLFGVFGVIWLMSNSDFSEYWWHLLLMIGSGIVMLFAPKKAKFDDYSGIYFGYTAITSVVVLIAVFFSSVDFGMKLLSIILVPIVFGGSYVIPSIIGIGLNKIIKFLIK